MGTEDDLILNFVFLKMGLIPQQFTLHKFSYRSTGASRHSQAFVYALAEIDLQGEYLDCHTPICWKLPGAEVGVTVRCPM